MYPEASKEQVKSPAEVQNHIDRVKNRVAQLRASKAEGGENKSAHMTTQPTSDKLRSLVGSQVLTSPTKLKLEPCEHPFLQETEKKDKLNPADSREDEPVLQPEPTKTCNTKTFQDYEVRLGNTCTTDEGTISSMATETEDQTDQGSQNCRIEPESLGDAEIEDQLNPVDDRDDEPSGSCHRESTQTTQESNVFIEDTTTAEVAPISTVTKEPEKQADRENKRCPICAGPLLNKYNPDDDIDKSTGKLNQPDSSVSCSLVMPFQELLSELMGTKQMQEDYATQLSLANNTDKENSKLKDGNTLYCVICQAYIVKDEDELKKCIEEKEREIAELERKRSLEIREVVRELKNEMAELDAQYKEKLEEMQNDRTNLEEDHNKRIGEIESIKEEQEKQIEKLLAKVFHGEELRRNLHNHLQELRGNVRVFVRTRPVIKEDCVPKGEVSPIVISPDNVSLSMHDARSAKIHNFIFDRVFPPGGTQKDVFDEVADFVQSALDGYNVCLFSYGQTGAGKTFTMQGSDVGEKQGIIPRSILKILAQAKSMEASNWEFSMSASFLEIYNEELRDLLWKPDKTKKQPPKLAIVHDKEGKTIVENLTKFEVDTYDTIMGMKQLKVLMRQAVHARSVASTKMSTDSSRSHAVFMLHLRGTNKKTGTVVNGKLNLCDLAGSERLDHSGTGSDATRLRETKAINKSLSSLGAVFNALSTGAKHVPYRNSKLTFLLQDCLSGDGKALMFVNLSPTVPSGFESLCSLRFAQQVRQVSFGKITRNVQYADRK